ncbi:MAG TPA: clan AA aspartic protease [Gemmataceae bacterium]|nr:clan AA aspartic protease [Gemmataceae bacterium]
MITGKVNADLEARINLQIKSSTGTGPVVSAVIDTGFTGFLALPIAVLSALNAPWLYYQEGILADGSTQVFDVHEVTIVWDGQPRTIEVEAIDAEPLAGMALLEHHEVHLAVVSGGEVRIEACT